MAKRRKPARRTPGSGYITPLSDGRAKAHYPKPNGGYFVKRCDSAEEAARWLAELAARDKESYDLAGGQQSLEKWLNQWVLALEDDPDDPPKAKTIADYRFKLGYAIDLLGSMPIADIKPDHADSAMRLVRKQLAQSTADQIRNLFWRAMEEAVQRDYIPRNPVKRATRRRKARQSATGRSIYRLNTHEAARLLAASSERLEALAWWLFLTLGLREGEVLGLRRADLNLSQATITIAQQYTQLAGRAHHSTTKTPYSDRTLPIPRALVPMFEDLMQTLTRRAALATKRGTWQEHQLLFPGKSGRPMNPSSIYHMLKRLAPQAQIPASITIHDLRHTAAAFYTAIGAPDVVRGAIAGHSPKSITDHYGKPAIETLRPWVEQVYGLLGGQVAHEGRKSA